VSLADGCCWHDPEAFESENKFRLLRCCGHDLLATSSSLHDPKRSLTVHRGIEEILCPLLHEHDPFRRVPWQSKSGGENSLSVLAVQPL
jgi:hypothetical protein